MCGYYTVKFTSIKGLEHSFQMDVKWMWHKLCMTWLFGGPYFYCWLCLHVSKQPCPKDYFEMSIIQENILRLPLNLKRWSPLSILNPQYLRLWWRMINWLIFKVMGSGFFFCLVCCLLSEARGEIIIIHNMHMKYLKLDHIVSSIKYSTLSHSDAWMDFLFLL